MDLAHLSSSTRFLSMSPRKVALFCTYEETNPLRFTQSGIDEGVTLSDSVTFTYRGKPLAGICKPSFVACTRDFLDLLLSLSESELEKEDS